jgi:hypothetical protein
VSDGRYGITVIRQQRGGDYTSAGFDAHDNTVCLQQGQSGYAHDFEGGDFAVSWDRNAYYADGGEAWRADDPADWDAWRAAGNDPGGSLAPADACPAAPFGPDAVGPGAL